MFIGTPKEIKTDEFRVGLVPATVADLVAQGHAVAIETRAGEGAGISDDDYAAAGAKIVPTADEIFRRAELIVKVKEPLASERRKLRPGQMIFTYLHLAPDPEQTHDLMASGVTAIAYETVTDAQGKLPLLAPMSAVAGRMAPQVAAHFLERPHGGRGLLLGGIEGAPSAEIIILGGGVVASNAATVALGMGAEVTVVTRRPETMRGLAELFGARARIVPASKEAIEALCLSADVVIGAALVVGAAAPKLISARTVAAMSPGAVIVDVSIDQGGCAETSRPTTHSHPTYLVNGVVHYCVANMPGAVRAPPRLRSTMPRILSYWRLPTKDFRALSSIMRICATGSACIKVRSPAAPWLTRFGCPICPPPMCSEHDRDPACRIRLLSN